ncbi:PAS domain S-box protein [Methylobacterium terricola]|uniref:histidine kinase n=1 Tax=Methylobacterium terricola TaxID=2583531 RepID=A0A5C4L526_9HYPH|nr:PAS domain S-box protein [Methylobacterium terricola]TNC05787.1 PAS domain S-box protein [Methylobacterium terricola]
MAADTRARGELASPIEAGEGAGEGAGKRAGECERLVASRDWSGTALGPITAWPQSLRTATALLLRSPVPMVMLWGEDGIMIYNDAYSVFAGGRHPDLLGAKVREGWPEVAGFNDHVMHVGLAGGTLSYKDKELTLYRHGGPEQVWMNLDYSPVPDESGRPAGVLCVLAETTAHVAAERELKDSEARLAAIFAGATVGLSEVGLDGRFLRVNEELCRLLGRQPDALLSLTFADVTHPDDMRPSRDSVARVLGGGGTASLDKRYRRPDGTIVWANSRITRLVDARGEPGNLLVATVDLTERHGAEERLRASEARFRLMADAVPQIVWITDAEGRTEFFNRQWTAYTGVPYEPTNAAEVAAHHIHPDDAAATMAAFEAAQRSGSTFLAEHRIRSAQGTYRWFLVRAEPYRDAATGAVVRWFGASVDIHDRKLAETALLALNADLEREVVERTRERGLIWRHSLDLLSVIDLAGGTFDAVNPAWTAALGWATAEFEGRSYSTFVHPDDLGASAGALAQVRQGLPLLRFENRYRAKDGGWRWLSWVAVPEAGKLYSVTRDVTEEKERRAALEAAQDALRQSQKMEAMGQLTGGVAHDFNNLLTPIVGSLDLLQRRGVGGEREQRLIAGAMQAAERAKTLVQRLLAFARRQPLQATAVDVARLVTGMGDLVASTTGPQIRVVVEVPNDLPPAKADPNQLEMALLNLSVNARDAMPEGGTLRITAGEEHVAEGHRTGLNPGPYIRLSVADTGTGMDEATLARAVEPFFSTKGIGKGTGLGLSMVHGLASQLSGALTLRSRPGLGTDVALWLPLSEAAPEPPATVAEPLDAAPARRTALLVDDEELVRLSTADMLGDLGYTVVEARSAEEALRLVERGEPFDLLVTDHLMPGLTGTDLARAVRTARPGMPVLLVSGYAESDGVATDLPRLVKPFRKAELAASLARLAGG